MDCALPVPSQFVLRPPFFDRQYDPFRQYKLRRRRRQLAPFSGACVGRDPTRLHGGAEGSVVPFGLIGVGLRKVGDRPIEALALA